MGTLVAYAGSAYLMAWGPIMREPIYLAAQRERGLTAVLRRLILYLVVGTAWVMLALAVFSHQLVHVASNRYAAAAPLIPLLGLRWGTKSFFQSLYRASTVWFKQRVFVYLTVLSAIVFLTLALILIPRIGVYGAAISAGVAPLVGAIGMRWVSTRHGEPAALALGCWGTARLVGNSIPVGLVATALYPVLLVATRVVPLAEVSAMLSTRTKLGGATLTPKETAVVHGIASRRDPRRVAQALKLTEEEIDRNLIAGLRKLVGLPVDPTTSDREVVRYLCWRGSRGERDSLARTLWRMGVDPLELDRLDTALRGLRGIRLRRWHRASTRQANRA
jgi:hypothetical protein